MIDFQVSCEISFSDFFLFILGSAVSIGAFVMTILAGFLSDYIGKKRTLMLLAFPNLIFWVMIYLCYHAYEIIIARTIAGMTGRLTAFILKESLKF